MSSSIQIIGIDSIPEVHLGDNLGHIISKYASLQGVSIENKDVLVVTQKVISKAEGQVVDLSQITPSALAIEIANEHQRDPRHTEVVLRETRRVVRMDQHVIIAETHHGFRCANAGVDASNLTTNGTVSLLPVNPDESAQKIRLHFRETMGVEIGVVVSDTFGRPWREGATNVAIGIAGLRALRDYQGQEDPQGQRLKTTTIAVADELASAAELVMGKLDRVPVALIKGYRYIKGNEGIKALIRPPDRDLFR